VPLFFKQWGGVNKKKTGRELNGRTYDNLPVSVEQRRVSLTMMD
jgi:protein gp37